MVLKIKEPGFVWQYDVQPLSAVFVLEHGFIQVEFNDENEASDAVNWLTNFGIESMSYSGDSYLFIYPAMKSTTKVVVFE